MIHPITTTDPAAGDPMFAWQTPDGDLVLLGERHVMAALADDLAAFKRAVRTQDRFIRWTTWVVVILIPLVIFLATVKPAAPTF